MNIKGWHKAYGRNGMQYGWTLTNELGQYIAVMRLKKMKEYNLKRMLQ